MRVVVACIQCGQCCEIDIEGAWRPWGQWKDKGPITGPGSGSCGDCDGGAYEAAWNGEADSRFAWLFFLWGNRTPALGHVIGKKGKKITSRKESESDVE